MAALLEYLNEDVLRLILDKLYDTSSPNSVLALSLSNRLLREICKPFVLRRVTLDFDRENVVLTNHRIARWCKNEFEVARKSIWSITVTSAHGPVNLTQPTPSEQDYAGLAELLAGLVRLKDFTFACRYPIPLSILDILHDHQPDVRLHISNWTRKSPGALFGDTVELRLAGSPLLRSIRAKISQDQGGDVDLQRLAFTRIVLLAPNLESYHYETEHLGSGPDWRRINMEEKARFDVVHENHKPKVLKAVHLGEGFSCRLLNLLDWTKLQSLTGVKIYQHSHPPPDGSLFPSLKRLSLEFSNSSDIPNAPAYNTFLASLFLESLFITNGLKYLSLPILLAHHGHSLQTLHLHEVESPRETNRRTTLSLDELGLIHDNCPNLVDLGIDIDRTDKREHENSIYAFLGKKMLVLTHLTIHFDLGLPFLDYRWDNRNSIRTKMLETAYTELQSSDLEALWEAVGGRVRKQSKLDTLTVFVGEPNRDIGGAGCQLPLSVYQEQEKRRKFVVERNERDDRRDEVVVREYR